MTDRSNGRPRDDAVADRMLGVLERWVGYANEQYADWPGRPRSGHFFGGSYWYMGETIATALALAVATTFGRLPDSVSHTQEVVRERIVRAIRYACFTHDTGPPDCVRVESKLHYVSRRKWGGSGDSFFMASQNGRSIAMLACLVVLMREELDSETQGLVRTVISSYAERWSVEEPRTGSYYDTQCEENSWTAAGVSAAAALFPDHPQADAWRAAFRRWARNAVTVPADRARHPHGLIDRAGGDSIETVTFHPDFTTENHGFVHPSYMCAGINLRAYHLVHAHMTGTEPDAAATFNNESLYSGAVRYWTGSDGVVVPVQGQDWWYNRQHDALVTHAVLAVHHRDRQAARIELNAIEAIEGIQASNSRGCLLEERGELCAINASHGQYANQLEHGAAADVALAYLLHRYSGPPPPPIDQDALLQRLRGVRHYPFGGIIVHRTEKSFTSFSYRNHVMGYSAPLEDLWVVTPHYLSFVGSVSDSSPVAADTSRSTGRETEPIVGEARGVRVQTRPDSFAIAATVPRLGRRVDQHVLFASLADGRSLYAEIIVARETTRIDVATGLVGVRNERYSALGDRASGKRVLRFDDGELEFAGFYGDDPDRVELLPPKDWINLDERVGYRLYRSGGARYLNRHRYAKWRGVEDQLVLNRRSDVHLVAGERLPTFAVVITPNQDSGSSGRERRDGRGRLLDGGDIAMGFIEGDTLVFARFESTGAPLELRGFADTRIHAFPGTQQIDRSKWTWATRAVGREVGMLDATATLDLDEAPEALLLVTSATAVALENRGDRPVTGRATMSDGSKRGFSIPPRASGILATDEGDPLRGGRGA